MSDSDSPPAPLFRYIVKGEDDDNPYQWEYSFIGWQDDEIMAKVQTVTRPWEEDEVAGRLDSTTAPLPSDVIIVQFSYDYRKYLVYRSWKNRDWDGRQVENVKLTASYWIKKASLHSDMDDEYEIASRLLKDAIISFDDEFVYVVPKIVKKMLNYACRLVSLPRNGDREGLSIVFEVNSERDVLGKPVWDDSIEDNVITEVPEVLESDSDDDGEDELSDLIEDLTLEEKAIYDDAIKSLARSKASSGDSATDCGVCVEQIVEGEEVIWMPCHHFFHGECLLKWLERKNSCPVCRYELAFSNVSFFPLTRKEN